MDASFGPYNMLNNWHIETAQLRELTKLRKQLLHAVKSWFLLASNENVNVYIARVTIVYYR